MRLQRLFIFAAAAAAFSPSGVPSWAAEFPEPMEGDYVIEDFTFNDGTVMPELNIHYTTVGDPSGLPVLVLHGTTGSGSGMASGAFADAMFGPGEPLDATKYYLILPDAIGHGDSSKPSDGMRADFPRYNAITTL